MELSERYIAQLEKEGFQNISEYQSKAGAAFPPHTHAGKVTVFITDGSITFELAEEKREIFAPMRFDIPVGISCSALVGEKGAIYLIGEEIDGDWCLPS